MRRTLKLLAALACIAVAVGCATLGGALVGTGIGHLAGDEKAGALIGTGVGVLVDSMD